MTLFFVQMSGFPGSGKSTLAQEIANKTGAIIVDHDISKSFLLTSLQEVPVDQTFIGKLAYDMDWSYIEFYLAQGKNIIFDSPCLYEVMVEKGTSLAKKYQAKYKYVECYLDDRQIINNRLKTRKRMISQIQEINSEEAFIYTLNSSKKPKECKSLTVNTDQQLESYIEIVLAYIEE